MRTGSRHGRALSLRGSRRTPSGGSSPVWAEPAGEGLGHPDDAPPPLPLFCGDHDPGGFRWAAPLTRVGSVEEPRRPSEARRFPRFEGFEIMLQHFDQLFTAEHRVQKPRMHLLPQGVIQMP